MIEKKMVVLMCKTGHSVCFYLTLVCIFVGATIESKSNDVIFLNKEIYLGEPKTVEMKMQYKLSAPNKTYRAKFVLLIPETLPNRQKVISKEWILPPTKIHKRDGGTYAEWILDKPKGDIDIGCIIKMEIYPFDYSRLNRDLGNKDDDLKKYLISEKFIETKSKVIVDLAQKSAPKRSKGGILLHSIFNSTIKNLDKYNFANEPKGALGALKLGGGDCTEYTDLFVALCRARGLPARHVHGIVASGFPDTPKHSWAEVYIPHNGWVRLDPFLVEAGKASFRRLKNYYITLNYNRNDGIYSKDNGVWYWRYNYWGDPIAISEKLDCGYGVFSERVSSIKGDK